MASSNKKLTEAIDEWLGANEKLWKGFMTSAVLLNTKIAASGHEPTEKIKTAVMGDFDMIIGRLVTHLLSKGFTPAEIAKVQRNIK